MSARLFQPQSKPELAQLDLIELLGLDEAEFRQRFRHTPLWRAKRNGLRRNVCIALGNARNPSAIPALQHAALDVDPVTAEAARWALAQIQQGARSSVPSP